MSRKAGGAAGACHSGDAERRSVSRRLRAEKIFDGGARSARRGGAFHQICSAIERAHCRNLQVRTVSKSRQGHQVAARRVADQGDTLWIDPELSGIGSNELQSACDIVNLRRMTMGWRETVVDAKPRKSVFRQQIEKRSERAAFIAPGPSAAVYQDGSRKWPSAHGNRGVEP
jgi:hypothetical protein